MPILRCASFLMVSLLLSACPFSSSSKCCSGVSDLGGCNRAGVHHEVGESWDGCTCMGDDQMVCEDSDDAGQADDAGR